MIEIEIERSNIEKLIKENERMIYKLASSFSSSYEDLYQVGVIGLINAYNNFDSSYNVKFSTYAYPFILGEMKKYIRENKSIKISREISYLSTRLDKLIELLSQKYKRMPTTSELSIETGIEEWKIIEALGIKNCVRSLDEPLDTDGKEITLIDTIGDSSKIDNIIDFNDALNSLDEDERKIISARYFDDKSQSEVAQIIGFSQAKVSRKEQNGLCKLKDYYKISA